MPEAVSSGLGRNGPWLQNQWLRVETRQDDASISLVALAGAFRPTERALAYAEPAGEAPIEFERADYDIEPYEDAIGRHGGRRLSLTSTVARRGVALRREVVLFDAHPFALTRVGVTNQRAAPLALAALHVFSTPPEGRGRLQLAAAPADWRIYREGWQSWSPTMSFGGNERDVRSKPPQAAAEPPESEPGRFACDDVGVLFDPVAGRSLLAGVVTARDFISQVYVDAPAKRVDARCLADGTTVAPGETRWSEWFAIDVAGHPNEQLARYGDALGRTMGARIPKQTTAGWCSWYYFYTTVTEDDVVRNLRFLEKHRRELPIDTVQIDDGYQADIGDWLTANEKFPHGMAWLAREIKSAGYTPGLWLAPFLLAESSATLKQHPEFAVRDDAGQPALATNNWLRRNFGLDGTHPDAQAWLTGLFRAVCDGWGYDYVKIDFLFGAAIAGRRHDPNATRVQAYRAAMDAVRRGVGDERFILGCGAPIAPSVGYFDGNRIGPDVSPYWRKLTREERAQPRPPARTANDLESTETAIRNALTRSWMHGRLWANDPDCLLVRTDRQKLTLDEIQSLTTVIGLSAGMMLSSDDLDKVPPERLELISMLLPVLPKAGVPADLMARDMPERFEVEFERDFDPVRLIVMFNFEDETRDLVLGVGPGRWHAYELWEERYRGVVEGEVALPLVAAHGCRLLALRPADGVPRVVGTTAHVGMGMLDITGQAFDAVKGILSVDVSPAGRARRKVVVATGERSVVRATFAGQPVAPESRGEAVSVDIDVNERGVLQIQFA